MNNEENIHTLYSKMSNQGSNELNQTINIKDEQIIRNRIIVRFSQYTKIEL